jgi:hypothetical protein
MKRIPTNMAGRVHLLRVIHEIGFPGWPDLNLD